MPSPITADRLAERRLARGERPAARSRRGSPSTRRPGRAPSGTRTARLTGTSISSAWFAIPAPAQATRSPARKPLDLVADVDHDARRPSSRSAARRRADPATRLYVRTKPSSFASSSDALRVVRLLERAPVERQPRHAARSSSRCPTLTHECSTRTRSDRAATPAGPGPLRRRRRRRGSAPASRTYSFHQSAKLSRYQTSGAALLGRRAHHLVAVEEVGLRAERPRAPGARVSPSRSKNHS